MPSPRICRVSFEDTEGLTHTVAVPASTLYEAAALAVAEFRRCALADAVPGPASSLRVAVESVEAHDVPMRKLTAWLQGGGKTPAEQVLKTRLRELLGPTPHP